MSWCCLALSGSSQLHSEPTVNTPGNNQSKWRQHHLVSSGAARQASLYVTAAVPRLTTHTNPFTSPDNPGALFPRWGETQQEKQTSQILFIILQIDYLFYCSFKDRGEYLWSSKNQIEILWTWLWIYTFILCLGKLLHLLCNVFIFLLIN